MDFRKRLVSVSLSDMDESMNSVHSISAMDISPATSPRMALNPLPSNPFVLNAFHQQQQLLSNVSFIAPTINKNPIADECDTDIGLYSTVLTEHSPDEPNQLRQRMLAEPVPSVVESTSLSNASGRSSSKIVLLTIPIVLLVVYFIAQFLHPSVVVPCASSWQNASEYLTENLVGQDQGVREFKETMEKHKNFSIVLIEGPIGTGKSHLASSLEKFLPTTLISINTLLGLPSHHWTDSDRLVSYLSSHLSSTFFQFLILDDLDLLTNNEHYCQTLTTALHAINSKKNLCILLLHTGTTSKICRENFEHILTKSIQFHLLSRQHIQTCIQKEAYTQNVQPPFNNLQMEKMLNSLEYVNQQGVLYSTTGCKQIPSLVMLASRRNHTDN